MAGRVRTKTGNYSGKGAAVARPWTASLELCISLLGGSVFAATTFALAPALQSRIIAEAGDAPNLASGAIQAAFNMANALGAWLGGLVIAAGLGYTAPAAVASALALCGLAVAAWSGRLERAGHRTGRPGPTLPPQAAEQPTAAGRPS